MEVSGMGQEPVDDDNKLLHSDIGSSSDALHWYDLVCVGFSCFQLGLAIALKEAGSKARVVFVEKKSNFSWHSSPQLPGLRMQSPFIHDLATPRNPRSAFTFLNYLHYHERVHHFANLSTLRPLEEEFLDYLKWCADQFNDSVYYGLDATKIRPLRRGRLPANGWCLDVHDVSGSSKMQIFTKNVMFPRHQQVKTPVEFPIQLLRSHIIPISQYAEQRSAILEHDSALRIAVVGRGPESIEVLSDIAINVHHGHVTFFAPSSLFYGERPLLEFASNIETAPPNEKPLLCSYWSQRSEEPEQSSIPAETLRKLYATTYDKHISSKGQFAFDVAPMSRHSRLPPIPGGSGSISNYDIVLADLETSDGRDGCLLKDLDHLVLGARSKGSVVDEMIFKRGTVQPNRSAWMVASGGSQHLSLPIDLATKAGDIAAMVSVEEESESFFLSSTM